MKIARGSTLLESFQKLPLIQRCIARIAIPSAGGVRAFFDIRRLQPKAAISEKMLLEAGASCVIRE